MGAERLSPIAIALTLVATGCYASHDRADDGRDGGPRADAGARDAGRRRDAGEIDLPDAGPTGCDVWEPAQPVQITFRDGDNTGLDVESTGVGYLVVTVSTNPARDRSRFATLAALGGPVSTPNVLFDPGAPVSLGTSLAAHRGAIAATRSDERGCVFRRVITPDGLTLGEVVRYPPSVGRCNGLIGHSRGWTFFDRDRGEVGVVSPDGTLQSQTPLAIFEGDVFWWARMRRSDNDFLVAAIDGLGGTGEVRLQRMDRAGAPITAPEPIVALGPETTRVRLADPSGPPLVGVLVSFRDRPGSQLVTPQLFRYDLERRSVEPVPAPSLPVVYRDAGWSLVSIGDAIFVVYVEPEPGDESGDRTRLRAARLGDAAEPFTLAEGRFLRSVQARTDGRDLFVTYRASVAPDSHVFGAGLRCVR